MSDLISRSRLLEEIKRYQMDIVSKATAMKVIRNAPTVTDTNVGGKWSGEKRRCDMERLTTRHCGVAVIKDKSKLKEAMEKLAAYEEAEKRRINPGDTVYVIDEERDGVREYSVSKVTYGKYHDVLRFVGGSRFTVWGREWDEYLDKYLFKNKEEAETALTRMEKENG